MSKVTVADKVAGVYQVIVERTVAIGDKCHIAPSMGYAGVEYGLVKVDDIVTGEEYLAAPHRFEGITQHIAIAVTGADGDIDLDSLPTDEKAAYDELINTPWVGYRYVSNKEMGNTIFYFPMDEFIEHTSNII